MEVYNNFEWYIHLKKVDEFDWGNEDNKKKLVKEGYEYLPVIKTDRINTYLEQSPIIGVAVKQEEGNTFSSSLNETPSHKITFFVYNINTNMMNVVHLHDWEIEDIEFDEENCDDNDTYYEYILSLLWTQNRVGNLIDIERASHHPFDWLNVANSNLEDSYLINREVIQAFNDSTYINIIWRGKYDQVMKERDELKKERDDLLGKVKELEARVEQLKYLKDDRVTAENCRHFE